MYWADSVVDEIKKRYTKDIALGVSLVVRDEKTSSGRVHVGSLRGVAIHGIVSEVLRQNGIKEKYLFEINDFDPMDGLPVYLDKEKFMPFMGKPLCDVPSPDIKYSNYAEYFAEEFKGVIGQIGFKPEFYRSSEIYKSGKYNNLIKIALEKADKIKEIYKRVSGSVKNDDWLPLNVVCENCGKVGTTKARNFDGKTVEYTCGKFVDWADGCGHNARISPFDGNAKLPWKVEWAAKFTVFDVRVEGGGKDHSTKGGAREIADAISREVFDREPPMNIPYEFFVVGGKKMSSSKGAGSSSREIADLLPPNILRFLLIHKEPNKVIDFIPDGDTVPVLFDTYDKYAESYFSKIEDDYARAFYLSHDEQSRHKLIPHVMPRFSNVAYLVQMPHINIRKEVELLSGTILDKEGEVELEIRAKYAKVWLDRFAPDDYKFEIQKQLPESAKSLGADQKQALKEILVYITSVDVLDGQTLHTTLHDIKTKLNIRPQDFFGAIYLSILGKKSGPKAGWFLSVLDKNFLLRRLEEASK